MKESIMKELNNNYNQNGEDKYAAYRPNDVDKGIAILSAVCLTVALSIIVIPMFVEFDSFGTF